MSGLRRVTLFQPFNRFTPFKPFKTLPDENLYSGYGEQREFVPKRLERFELSGSG